MTELTLADIAHMVNGTLDGDPRAVISGVESLTRARKQHLTFYTGMGRKSHAKFVACKAGCVLVKPGVEKPEKTAAMIFVEDPDGAFTAVCEKMLPHPRPVKPGVHATAVVAPSAKLGKNVYIGPYVVISEDVSIGDGAVIHAHCVLMEGVKIGAGCLIYPGCVLREFVILGERVVLLPGVVLGAEGFGMRFRNGMLEQVPQLGTVELEDNVLVGANSAIDRARFGKTRIKKDTKIDNLVQIGHNVEIGRACGIAALTGIGGSTVIGDFCNISGQAGIANDVEIGPGAKLLARCGVEGDVEPGAEVYFQPVMPGSAYQRNKIYTKRLPDLFERVKQLEAQLTKLLHEREEDTRG